MSMDAYDDLSLSGQINAAYGAQPPSRKRRRDDDLFDVLDTGDNSAGSGQAPPPGMFYPGTFSINADGLGLNGQPSSTDMLIMTSADYAPPQFDGPTNPLGQSNGTMDVEKDEELGASSSLSLQVPTSIFLSGNSTIGSSNQMAVTPGGPFSPSSTASMPVTPSTVPPSPNPMAHAMTIKPPQHTQQVLLPEQATPPTRSAEGLVAVTRQKVDEVKISQEKLKWQQAEVLLNPNPHPSDLENLRSIHREVGQNLSQAQGMITELRSQYILQPLEIHLLQSLQHEMDILHKQLEVYVSELRYYHASQNQYVPPAVLIITQHPFPKSVKQNKPMDDGVTVRLLCGAAASVLPAGPCTAQLIAEHTSRATKKPAAAMQVQNNVKAMDNFAVQFTELSFPVGTRKKTIHLKFSVPIIVTRSGAYANHPMQYTIESNVSLPFIVKTNENQWDESEGILLKSEAFGSLTEARWCQFANVLQRRYLAATKQDILKPVRPLSVQDLNYLYLVKFSPNGSLPTSETIITTAAYDEFWSWFGPGLHRIRYQRHLCPLWVKGYICGFLQRYDADKVLQQAVPGTFVLRLSERCPGQFALAYVVLEDGIRSISHYLIKPDDVFGAKKTLPDFLSNLRNLTHIVQICCDTAGNRVYRAIDKEAVLSEYYSKRDQSTPPGYEESPPR